MDSISKENKKIKLLVAFVAVHVGGAMTSLVNFLNALDTDKYDVDVLFYEHNGDRCGIKDEINILPQAMVHNKYSFKNIFSKGLSPSYMYAKFREQYHLRVKKNKKRSIQIISKQGCRYSRRLREEYDVAIAYEYLWPLNYVTKYVKARKKILWHHLDYAASGFAFREDKAALDSADCLVFMSEKCLELYSEAHPEHSSKCMFMPNMLTSSYVRARGEQPVRLPFDNSDDLLRFVTIARIDFNHKGIDRAVRVFEKLRDEGLLDNVKWTIIGYGNDYEELCSMISQKQLGDYIYAVGLKENPIPYLKVSDVFLLPSHFEGKPMVVTEALIMGLVPVVTRYSSADEQIKSGYDGLVFDNSEEALYLGLKALLENREQLDEMKKNIKATNYGNEFEIKRFDEIIEKIL